MTTWCRSGHNDCCEWLLTVLADFCDIIEKLPALFALVTYAPRRYNVLQTDTALAGFSQGANMALQLSVSGKGMV